MISVEHLVKKYDKVIAVNDISFTVHPGEVTVLLGPNGAGKSTAIKSIAGLLNYEGRITICGVPNKSIEAKKIFGYVPEIPALFDLMTVWDHAEFIAKAYRLADGWQQEAEQLLRRFEILDKKDTLCRELSKGMLQKVSIVLALMIGPRAVLFDEPLIGLDPKAISEMLEMFEELKQKDISILISTHIIDTINDVWDRAYMMNKGSIVYETTREESKCKDLKALFFEMTSMEVSE
ncbi:MAG: ABC transporter ATP-binding protein [Bacillota bacterium]|nr:ABC transporter ATP-binding protein [Bacillota bacterium]